MSDKIWTAVLEQELYIIYCEQDNGNMIHHSAVAVIKQSSEIIGYVPHFSFKIVIAQWREPHR